MPSSIVIYDGFYDALARKKINLASDTLKLLLVTSSYTPSQAHNVLADVLSSPSPEVVAVASPDNGYTTGGEALTGVTLTQSGSPIRSILDANDVTWTALTATFRYGILYDDTATDDDLIAYLIFDTTPADITISAIDFIVQWSSSGIIDWGAAA